MMNKTLDRYIRFVIMLYFFMRAFDGVLRYGFNLIHLSLLSYLPIVLMAIGIFVKIICVFFNMKMRVQSLVVISIVLVFVINGIIQISSIKQTVWGIYILIPFGFGFTFSLFFLNKIQKYTSFFYWLLILTVFGVILDYFVQYPWQGFSYEVAGELVEGSRQWRTHSSVRIPGFGRSSFSSAVMICVLSVFVLIFKKPNMKIVFLWGWSLLAIILTTTKGVMVVYLVITLLISFKKWIHPFILKKAPLLIVILMIALPFASAYYFRNDFIPITYSEDNLDSFFIRITSTWPQGISVITTNGNVILGRGIGGIGIPSSKANDIVPAGPGDNMAVYLYGIGGVFGLFSILWLAINSSKFIIVRYIKKYWLSYIFVIFIFLYGITTNVIESAILSFILGVVIRNIMHIRKHSDDLC